MLLKVSPVVEVILVVVKPCRTALRNFRTIFDIHDENVKIKEKFTCKAGSETGSGCLLATAVQFNVFVEGTEKILLRRGFPCCSMLFLQRLGDMMRASPFDIGV